MLKCESCGIEKEDIEFYWTTGRVRKISACKKCKINQQKEYAQTEEGKLAQKKANAKYHKTAKGRASQKKGKAKYAKTDKGRATKAKADATYQAKKRANLNEPTSK